jgi:ubiquinone/menaquinone biosynthesis C-methylase UbiE
MNKYLEQAEKYARNYDRGAAEQDYHGPEVIFGLMFEYLEESHLVFDIAIGTGLDAVLFRKAGNRVFGIDGSAEMLRICEKKKVAVELKQVDLLREPVPYPDEYFDHAIANSFFHMIEDPSPVFSEASRVLKKGGIFGFTYDEMSPGKSPPYQKTGKKGVFRTKHGESGLNIYRHTDEFIRSLCMKSRFDIRKKIDFMCLRGKDGMDDFYYTACITLKQ